jgi:gluconokinase
MMIIAMGVTGSGKTTFGRELARALKCPFYDADDFHTPASIAKMRAGMPLIDADRLPWLDRLRAVTEATLASGTSAVLACSALRNAYRERLLPLDPAAAAAVRFVYLRISPELARARLLARPGHYMPASLVASQFAALQPPPPGDSRILTLDGSLPVETLVHSALSELK